MIPNVAKLFQKIIKLRLMSFIDKNKILQSNQFGFVKDSGTKDAIAKFRNLTNSAGDETEPGLNNICRS